MEATDGQKLTLGDTTVTLYITAPAIPHGHHFQCVSGKG